MAAERHKSMNIWTIEPKSPSSKSRSSQETRAKVNGAWRQDLMTKQGTWHLRGSVYGLPCWLLIGKQGLAI